MWTYGVNNNRQILICNPKANDTQTCLTWNSYPYVANNSKWHTNIFVLKQLSICGKQQLMTYQHVGHETVIHVANNSKWHTIIFDMKHLSICDKQQQMTYKHFRHETVTIGGMTTATDTQICLTWNSYPYVANNSKWHTNMFDMKRLSICGNNSKWHTGMFHMKQLSIWGKQQ